MIQSVCSKNYLFLDLHQRGFETGTGLHVSPDTTTQLVISNGQCFEVLIIFTDLVVQD